MSAEGMVLSPIGLGNVRGCCWKAPHSSQGFGAAARRWLLDYPSCRQNRPALKNHGQLLSRCGPWNLCARPNEEIDHWSRHVFSSRSSTIAGCSNLGSSGFRDGSLYTLVSSVCTERQHASFSAPRPVAVRCRGVPAVGVSLVNGRKSGSESLRKWRTEGELRAPTRYFELFGGP